MNEKIESWTIQENWIKIRNMSIEWKKDEVEPHKSKKWINFINVTSIGMYESLCKHFVLQIFITWHDEDFLFIFYYIILYEALRLLERKGEMTWVSMFAY